jgi:Helicase HerA, central domain
MAKKPIWLTDNLVLGWKLTKPMAPQYWDTDKAKPGFHELSDVVTALPKTIAHHTVIIAQSGSGKSFFLGRLLEEILLKTSSRILILDQNSDFRKIAQPKPKEFWTDPTKYRYDRVTHRGFLADERTQADFTSRWDKLTKLLHGNNPPGEVECKPLRLDWLKFPVDLLAESADQRNRDQLRHCHSFVNIVAELASATGNQPWLKDGEFLHLAHDLCLRTSDPDEETVVQELKKTFGLTERKKRGQTTTSTDWRGKTFVELPRHLPTLANIFAKERVRREDLPLSCHRAATHRRFVLPEAVRFYFSRAVELEQSKVVHANISKILKEPDYRRIEVVDLPSLPDGRHQKLAMCTFLEVEWQRARREWEKAIALKNADDDKRVPTFIVVEEAHNAMPAVPATATEITLQEQFRRIAAEGRKYGLFLILVSQRPEKLDQMIMSECENRAVMRLGSKVVLRSTCEILALDNVMPRMTDKALEFELGRALLAGPWVADEPTFLVSAARRTEEGGRDLQFKHWAKPELHTEADAGKPV